MRVVLVVVLLIVAFASFSLYGALRTPGNESFKAKWADWLRDHHAAWVVDHLEASYFASQAPPVGGHPRNLAAVRPPVVASGGGSAARSRATHLSPPPPVVLLVAGLSGEGRWQPTGPLVDGRPAMYVAQVRPDTVHTSVLTGVVWMDPTALRLTLVPGAREPGGAWPVPPDLSGPLARTVVAAFNGGFRFKDANGGFYAYGRQAVPLVDGAASFVVDRSGRVDVGQWRRDDRLRPTTTAVLQNLVLLVDNGRPVPGIGAGDPRRWGHTLGNKVLVWRSAVGVDRQGGVLYAAGPGLTAETLAGVMARAGAVRAMALDINPEWVTFNLFDHPNPADPSVIVGRKLLPGMQRPADRYINRESRDFVAVTTG